MLPNEHFQKLLYDLFCLWHSVQRHYDPPFTDTEDQRLTKVLQLAFISIGSPLQELRYFAASE